MKVAEPTPAQKLLIEVHKLLFDRKSAAWALSVSTRTIDYLIANGAFETRRIGRKVLITAASLKKYAAANHFGPVAGIEGVSHTSNPPMTDPFSWDKCNAIHEAGHAVMALLLGVPLCRVWLSEDNDGFGGCAHLIRDCETEVLIKFAGAGAELILRGFGGWSILFASSGRGDWREAQFYLRDIGGNHKALVRDTKSRVTQLLRDNWSWVLAVSQKLREKRYLEGCEVAALAPSCTGPKEETA
jgi:hypothetical protein